MKQRDRGMDASLQKTCRFGIGDGVILQLVSSQTS